MSITNRVLIECTRALCYAITNRERNEGGQVDNFEASLDDAMLADSLIEVTIDPPAPRVPIADAPTPTPTAITKTHIGLLDKMPMGKHRALSLAEVYDKYPDYMEWVKENVSNWTFADEPDLNAYARKAASKSKSTRTKEQKAEDRYEDDSEDVPF
jgi:hypothetical protein